MTRIGLLWGNLQMLSGSCRVKKSLRQMAIYMAYIMVLVLVWMFSPYEGASHEHLYFYTFLLGFITAFTKILGKFKDEPLRALETIQGSSITCLMALLRPSRSICSRPLTP